MGAENDIPKAVGTINRLINYIPVLPCYARLSDAKTFETALYVELVGLDERQFEARK